MNETATRTEMTQQELEQKAQEAQSNDVATAFGSMFGPQDAERSTENSKAQSARTTDDLEETIFNVEQFPELMGKDARPYTYRFAYKKTDFFCVAIPRDVLGSVQSRVNTIERSANRAVSRAQKLATAKLADKQKELKSGLEALRKSPDATALQVAQREIEIEDEIDALSEELQAEQTTQQMDALEQTEKLLGDLLSDYIRDWRDARWQFTPPCNAETIGSALPFADKLQLMQRLVSYSQSGQYASSFLDQSSSRG